MVHNISSFVQFTTVPDKHAAVSKLHPPLSNTGSWAWTAQQKFIFHSHIYALLTLTLFYRLLLIRLIVYKHTKGVDTQTCTNSLLLLRWLLSNCCGGGRGAGVGGDLMGLKRDALIFCGISLNKLLERRTEFNSRCFGYFVLPSNSNSKKENGKKKEWNFSTLATKTDGITSDFA